MHKMWLGTLWEGLTPTHIRVTQQQWLIEHVVTPLSHALECRLRLGQRHQLSLNNSYSVTIQRLKETVPKQQNAGNKQNKTKIVWSGPEKGPKVRSRDVQCQDQDRPSTATGVHACITVISILKVQGIPTMIRYCKWWNKECKEKKNNNVEIML